MLCNKVTSSKIPILFSVGSAQSAYKRSEFRNRLVQDSWEFSLVGDSHGKFVEEELEVGL
jgi:hypothetical protein